jgi:protein ImuB
MTHAPTPPARTRTLWACLRVPGLPVDVFARAWSAEAHARPFVVSSGGHYPRVVGANDAALAAGVRRDQLISAALALAPALALRERDAAAEAAALPTSPRTRSRSRRWSRSPLPRRSSPTSGPACRLFGGVRRLVGGLLEAVRAQGYDPALALAPTPAAALVLARAGRVAPVLSRAALPAALADVPLRWLDLTPRRATFSARRVIATFGDIAACRAPGSRGAWARRRRLRSIARSAACPTRACPMRRRRASPRACPCPRPRTMRRRWASRCSAWSRSFRNGSPHADSASRGSR